MINYLSLHKSSTNIHKKLSKLDPRNWIPATGSPTTGSPTTFYLCRVALAPEGPSNNNNDDDDDDNDAGILRT